MDSTTLPPYNGTTDAPYEEILEWDDATWVLISAFIIFTMQSGFGLLESGCVSSKNQVNIMYKNACDVIFGGLMYWMVGYGLQFGDWDHGARAFCGVGRFAVDVDNDLEMGDVFVSYVFQLSFACTATTIVSGAMAERVKLPAYIIYAFFNPAVAYAIPAHWVWDGYGWLSKLGVVDIAGSGVVHLCGGAAALVAAIVLGPRKGRFDNGTGSAPVGNGLNMILGTFILWWGWLGFNCGSTFGVQGGLWKLAGKSAVTTLNASMGGGVAGIIITLISNRGKFGVSDLCNSVLGALVGITASCAVVRPWESIVIGFIGGALAVGSTRLLDRLKIDDPVGAVSVHGISGIWGLLAVGIFMGEDNLSGLNKGNVGLIHGGGGYSLGIQAAAALSIIGWSSVTTFLVCVIIRFTIGLRMSEEQEELGADVTEHMIDQFNSLVVQKDNLDRLVVRRRSAYGETVPVGEGEQLDVQFDETTTSNSLRNRKVALPTSADLGESGKPANTVNGETKVFVVGDETSQQL